MIYAIAILLGIIIGTLAAIPISTMLWSLVRVVLGSAK